jgi:hypothetical protein
MTVSLWGEVWQEARASAKQYSQIALQHLISAKSRIVKAGCDRHL